VYSLDGAGHDDRTLLLSQCLARKYTEVYVLRTLLDGCASSLFRCVLNADMMCAVDGIDFSFDATARTRIWFIVFQNSNCLIAGISVKTD